MESSSGFAEASNSTHKCFLARTERKRNNLSFSNWKRNRTQRHFEGARLSPWSKPFLYCIYPASLSRPFPSSFSPPPFATPITPQNIKFQRTLTAENSKRMLGLRVRKVRATGVTRRCGAARNVVSKSRMDGIWAPSVVRNAFHPPSDELC